jgi:hypothetical protein
MSFNNLSANLISVGAANGGPIVTIGATTIEGDKIDFETFATPGASSVSSLMVPPTRVAAISYDQFTRIFEMAANGGVNLQISNRTSGQSVETIASENFMTGGVSLDISESFDGHMISMDSTGLKIFPGNGSPGITGATLMSTDEFGTCAWVGGSLWERIEALEKKAGIVSPERPKLKAGGPSPPRKSRIQQQVKIRTPNK